MLREFLNIKQAPGCGRRRWFEAEELELVLWLDPAGQIEGYQICYDLGKGERALTWRPRVGFAHSGVDGGEGRAGGNKMTPILVRGGAVPWSELTDCFEKNAGSLDPELRDLVRGTLAARW